MNPEDESDGGAKVNLDWTASSRPERSVQDKISAEIITNQTKIAGITPLKTSRQARTRFMDNEVRIIKSELESLGNRDDT